MVIAKDRQWVFRIGFHREQEVSDQQIQCKKKKLYVNIIIIWSQLFLLVFFSLFISPLVLM